MGFIYFVLIAPKPNC